MKGDCTPRGFEHVGKTVFCGKANQSKKEQGDPKAEEGLEDDHPVSTLTRADSPAGKKGGGSKVSWKLN
jgi:hypothetical protein